MKGKRILSKIHYRRKIFGGNLSPNAKFHSDEKRNTLKNYITCTGKYLKLEFFCRDTKFWKKYFATLH